MISESDLSLRQPAVSFLVSVYVDGVALRTEDENGRPSPSRGIIRT